MTGVFPTNLSLGFLTRSVKDKGRASLLVSKRRLTPNNTSSGLSINDTVGQQFPSSVSTPTPKLKSSICFCLPPG